MIICDALAIEPAVAKVTRFNFRAMRTYAGNPTRLIIGCDSAIE